MKTAFVLFGVLAMSLSAFAATYDCTVPAYDTTLELACQGSELEYLWPNYENVQQYYRCQGAGNPVVLNCPGNTYFSFVLQSCVSCDQYIPSQYCETLKIDKNSTCVPIAAETPKPTTSSTTSTTTTTTTTTTKKPAQTTPPVEENTTPTKSTSTSTTTTTTTKKPVTAPPTTLIPPPPVPSTADPNVPLPPVAPPTPPTIENIPPIESQPNTQ
ncbi:peritrophin-55 [Musca vetustissima]|uniref:peritrophin-55 n=1 Tax=Musca vetustissima TaxID=27455 RepID=UPI002AB7BD0B|nr:peritrophin-55 [Musca vetustissima]